MKKNILLKLSSLLLFTIIFVGCEGEEDVNYTPKVYDTVAGDLTAALLSPTTDNPVTMMPYDTNRAVEVQLSSSKEGIVYYAVDFASAASPSGANLVNDATGYTFTGKASLTAGNQFKSVFEEEILYGGYDYALFTVMASPDGYLSEVKKTLFTTPDTSDPMFLRDDSNPVFTAAGISPFAPVTFTFDEPVFYQGSDITFSGFNSGRVVTVSSADVTGSGTTSITVSNHGTFAESDFQIVTWAADTFKDNAGKSVAPLTGFSHYFSTRAFTLNEIAQLSQGMYDYSTVFYGGLNGFYNSIAGFLNTSPTGQFEIVTDASDASGFTLAGFNLFANMSTVPFAGDDALAIAAAAPATVPIKISPDDAGILAEIDPNTVPGGIPLTGGVDTYWSHYAGFFGPNPGFYDFNAGTITHWLTLYSEASDAAIDDIDYLYSRVPGTTYTRSSNSSMNNLKNKNSELKSKNGTNSSVNPGFATIK